MAIYKVKRFSSFENKFDSFSKKHPKFTTATILGLGGGVLGGSLFGKKGFVLGSLLGSGLGYKIGVSSEKYEKSKEEIFRNPKNYLKDLLDKNPMDYKNLGIDFPPELYKLIQVNKQFIPIAEKFIKEYKVFWEPGIILLDPKMILNEKEGVGDFEERGLLILADPEHFDDTWIIWYPSTKTFDFDFDLKNGKGSFSSLKKILIHFLEEKMNEGETSDLDKLYLNFIKKML